MREPAGAPPGTDRREEGTRASAPAHTAGSARGSSCTHPSARFLFRTVTNFCAIVCLPADRNTHACPTQTCVRGFQLMRPGSKPQRGCCHAAPPAEQARPLASLRTMSSPPSGCSTIGSVSGDNFRSTMTAVLRVLWPDTELPRSSAQHHRVAEHRYGRPRSWSGVHVYSCCSFSSRRRPTTPSINNIASPTISRQQPDTKLSEHRLLEVIVVEARRDSNH
jgi:hypothetical protein